MIIEEGTPVVRAAAARPRWPVVVVTAVAALAVAIGAVAGAFLVGGRGAGAGVGSAASYVPADAFMYLELRLDLPGDQRAMLRGVLDRFGDLNPDTVLGAELGKTLDDAVAKSQAPFRYTTDVAPWFNGQLAVAMNDYPSAADPAKMTFPSTVAFLGLRDATAATALADRLRAELQKRGSQFTSEMHGATQVWSLVADASAGTMQPGFAYAVTPDHLLLGSGTASVTTALDVHAGTRAALAGRDDLARLASRLPTDRVGFFAVDYAPVWKQLRAGAERTSPGLGKLFDTFATATPGLVVGAARFEADRLVFTSLSDAPTGTFAAANSQRSLARWIPGDAILVSEGGSFGPKLEQAVIALKAGMGVSGPSSQQIAQAEAALGGKLESYVSWIGDGALVAGWAGGQPYGGLVLVPTDVAAARQRLGQLAALATLGAGQAGGIRVSHQTVAGVDVTTFRSGAAAGGSMPVDGFAPSVVLQYAVTEQRVLIGLGDQFVGRALELQEADSLAASQRYLSALNEVGGTNNAGSTFVDLAALRTAIETAIPAASKAEYAQRIQPYVAPFDYLVGVARVVDGRLEQRAAIVVK